MFREGVAPEAYRRGGLRRVLDPAGDELAGDLRATVGGAPVIIRGANFINAFQTPRFAAAIESAAGSWSCPGC